MNKRYVFVGLGLLALATVLAVHGVPTPLKTGTLHAGEPAGMFACYTSGTSGELVSELGSGTAIVESQGGRRVVVTWPPGWTARSSIFGVEVLDTQGKVNARTGTHVSLMGGYWYVDDSFLTCGTVPE